MTGQPGAESPEPSLHPAGIQTALWTVLGAYHALSSLLRDVEHGHSGSVLTAMVVLQFELCQVAPLLKMI